VTESERRRARELLLRADVEVARFEKSRLEKENRHQRELLDFERDMAAALGSWEHAVKKGVERMAIEAKEAWEEIQIMFGRGKD
jgi:hypothetical protein